MSPEQFEGSEDALTPPSDIYALGGLLSYLLTGRLPHGDTPQDVVQNRARRAAPVPPTCERDLAAICMRAMSARRENRHYSAGEFADDLQRWLDHEPIPWTRASGFRRTRLWARRRPWRAAAVAACLATIVCLAGVAKYYANRDRHREAQAQQKALQAKDQELERLRDRGRTLIRGFVGHSMGPGTDLEGQVLPNLVWVEWLTGSPVIQMDEVPGVDKRVSMLRDLVSAQRVAGRGRHLGTLLAEYAMAQLLLSQGDATEATQLLDDLDIALAPHLSGDDSILRSLHAMRLCAEANAAVAAGKPLDGLASRLREADRALEAAGEGSATRRLIHGVLTRLEKSG